jgi:hypothetical protein
MPAGWYLDRRPERSPSAQWRHKAYYRDDPTQYGRHTLASARDNDYKP